MDTLGKDEAFLFLAITINSNKNLTFRLKQMNNRVRFTFMLAIFIGGFASLATELLVLRQLSSLVGSTAVIASVIIGAIMAFMSAGYYCGSVVSLRRFNLRRMIFYYFLIIAIMVILSSSFVLMLNYFQLMLKSGINSSLLRTILYSLIFLSLPSFLFGCIVSLLSRYLHKYNRNYTGRIMAIDTIGSVLGSVLSTLLLMPLIGTSHTVIVVVGLCLLGAFLFRRKNMDILWIVLVFCLGFYLNRSSLLRRAYNIVEDNNASTIAVVRVDNGRSTLMIQNGAQASKVSEDKELIFPYVRFIENNFLQTLPRDKVRHILVLGAGAFTLGREDDFHDYTYVDIDKSLQRVAEQYFLKKPLGRNKKFVVNDANQFLNETEKLYDLIIVDAYASERHIPIDLVTYEFFRRLRNHLQPEGIVVFNIATDSLFRDRFSQNIDYTLQQAFGPGLSRQTIKSFNPWQNETDFNNLIYYWRNTPYRPAVYTADKNTSFLDR